MVCVEVLVQIHRYSEGVEIGAHVQPATAKADQADIFCLVTSDSDFAYLCRKLRERGATVLIVGEAKTPDALRNACDQFFEWSVQLIARAARSSGPAAPYWSH
nr:NYN domain-containing protein [Stenotrophomonas rhizophila]